MLLSKVGKKVGIHGQNKGRGSMARYRRVCEGARLLQNRWYAVGYWKRLEIASYETTNTKTTLVINREGQFCIQGISGEEPIFFWEDEESRRRFERAAANAGADERHFRWALEDMRKTMWGAVYWYRVVRSWCWKIYFLTLYKVEGMRS